MTPLCPIRPRVRLRLRPPRRARAAPVPPVRRRGRLLLAGATRALSTSGLFARSIPLDTPGVMLWRGLAGAAGLVLLRLAMRGTEGLRDFGRLGRVGWLYALVSGPGMLCFFGALKATTIAHVAIIYATVPFFAAGLGWPAAGSCRGPF